MMLGLALHRPASTPWPWPPGSSFGVDFQKQLAIRYAQRVDFSGSFSVLRNSTKLVANSAGNLIPIATNMPALTDRGLLLEAECTNLCTYSAVPANATWFKTSVSLTTGIQDPAGGMDAVQITENASNANLSRQLIAVTPGQTYTLSRVMRRGNSDWVRLIIGDSGFGNAITCWFNLATRATGAHSASGSGVTFTAAGTSSLAQGYCLLWVTFVTTLTGINLGATSAAGDGTSSRANIGVGTGIGITYDLWNTQFELGTTASSAVISTTSPATRLADILALSLAPSSGNLTCTFDDGSTQSIDLSTPLPALFARPTVVRLAA